MTRKKTNPFVAHHLLAKIEKVNMKLEKDGLFCERIFGPIKSIILDYDVLRMLEFSYLQYLYLTGDGIICSN